MTSFQVLLVAGGLAASRGDKLSSSETVTWTNQYGPRPTWTLHPDSLMPARSGLKAARIEGTVFVTGGLGCEDMTKFNEILTWDPEKTVWSKVGDMTEAKYYHDVTTVSYNVISQFCVEP